MCLGAIELAPNGITAIAIAPEPEEVAAVARFPVSDEAANIDGHVVPVDGGFMAAGLLKA